MIVDMGGFLGQEVGLLKGDTGEELPNGGCEAGAFRIVECNAEKPSIGSLKHEARAEDHLFHHYFFYIASAYDDRIDVPSQGPCRLVSRVD